VIVYNESVKSPHTAPITLLNWNESYQKLTSVDKNGLMIIWINRAGKWVEEMVNESDKSLIRDVRWSNDGFYLCILVDDGQIIVGSVEGEKVWNKKVQKVPVMVEWSPDGRFMLVGTDKGEIMVFQHDGTYQYSIYIQCMNNLVNIPDGQNVTIPNYDLAAIEWFTGGRTADGNSTGLIIAYKVGRFQLMKSETDSQPTNIDAGITINEVKWNPRGELFAISGILNSGEGEPSGVIQFYDYNGSYLRVLKIDKATSVGPLTWSGDGLKLALGVSFSMFVASCKLTYKMCYLSASKTFVFALEKENRVDSCLVFYDTRRKTFKSNFLRYLVHLAGFEDHCLVVTRSEDNEAYSNIMICNSLGTCIETKIINFEPLNVAMNKLFVIAASTEHVYVWQYRAASTKSNLETDSKKMGRETAFALTEDPDPKRVYNYQNYQVNEEAEHLESLTEYIANINCTHNSLLVVTNTGRARKFNLPYLAHEADLAFSGKPLQVFSNRDGNRLAVIDSDNVLSFYTKEQDADFEKIDYEKKEVWAFMWSRDSNDQCCFLDKYRLNVMVNWVVTHLINTDSYLCDFNEMKILTVDAEFIMNSFDSENPSGISKAFYDCEIPSLVKIKKLLSERNYEEAFKQVATYNAPYLWEITAEQCLFNMDFDAAERAFVEYNNYAGLKFTQRIQSMDSKLLQKAEIYAFFQKYEEARDTLIRAERKDLAVQLMTKIGDYQGLELVIAKNDWDSALLNKVYRILGTYYKDNLNWKKAIHYFGLCEEMEEQIECLYMNRKIAELGSLVYQVNDPTLLLDIGEKLESLQSIEMAAKAYEKSGDAKRGVDICILNNYWGTAVELAERNNMVQIDGLISKYAKMLLDKNRKLEAIELFRKANRNPEAASMLNSLAKELIERNLSPLLIKKVDYSLQSFLFWQDSRSQISRRKFMI
jgi:WD repeat-containing protein 35